jgi:hypothetical protein
MVCGPHCHTIRARHLHKSGSQRLKPLGHHEDVHEARAHDHGTPRDVTMCVRPWAAQGCSVGLGPGTRPPCGAPRV